MSRLRRLPALGVALALLAGPLVMAAPASAAGEMYQPCYKLNSGQVKYPGFGAKRVTFAITAFQQQNQAMVTSCVKGAGGYYTQEWQERGFVGKNGFKAPGVPSGPTSQLYSPTGSFTVNEAFGANNPGTQLAYRPLNPSSRWGGQPGTPNYNKYFEPTQSWESSYPDENMWDLMQSGDYLQGVVLDYNRSPIVQNAGFAIFLHANPKPTAGCIALTLQTVTKFIKSATPGDRVIMGAEADIFSPFPSNPVGAIKAAYDASGGQTGRYGNPAGPETQVAGGGTYQQFQNGTTLYASPGGVQTVAAEFSAAYATSGGPHGPLGMPTSPQLTGPAVGGAAVQFQQFQRGRIVWSAATGARVVAGVIDAKYSALGSTRSAVGLPTGAVRPLRDGGLGQAFQKGAIYWSKATGTRVVTGAVQKAWVAAGAENGRLGYPAADQVSASGGFVQQFVGGAVTVSSAGKVTVAYKAPVAVTQPRAATQPLVLTR